MKLLIFAASHRPESYNRKLVKLAENYAKNKNIEVDFAEYAEFDMPLYKDENGAAEIAQSFARRAQKADGIIISTPEYNWSYPGTLKNILDWTSRIKPSPVAGKTAFILSATPGARGGIMALQHLKLPLEALGLFIYPKVFPLPRADQAFAGETKLSDAKQQTQLENLLDNYLDFTRKLST